MDVGHVTVSHICSNSLYSKVSILSATLLRKHERYCASLSLDARTRKAKELMLNLRKHHGVFTVRNKLQEAVT